MKKTILSIEDNPYNREMVRDLFESRGYCVIEAVDGEEGILMAEKEKPDLVLLDIRLPKISGYEVAKKIRANPQLKNIPIIALTSYALSGDEKKALEAGCDAYITKPYDPKLMLEKAESFLK